jgi:hypothetical protein
MRKSSGFGCDFGSDFGSDSDRSSLRVAGRVRGPCPFCHHRGGTIDCDFAQGMLFHSLPTCSAFQSKTADEFIEAVCNREHIQ